MELVFQEKQLDYLGRVLDQTVTQELTAEVIVPDAARMRTALSMRSARCSSARRSVPREVHRSAGRCRRVFCSSQRTDGSSGWRP